jgi:hypothetical protein
VAAGLSVAAPIKDTECDMPRNLPMYAAKAAAPVKKVAKRRGEPKIRPIFSKNSGQDQILPMLLMFLP